MCGVCDCDRALVAVTKCDEDPNGLGNHSDQVGLLLQGHYYRVVMGLKAKLIWDDIGFGVITATVN